ncbi:MAG TPA: transporter [Hellea balneolensis]|uniref:Transporter n=1 Tax=Hellea balneolensis TaxID=287478 RepID=A0A7C3CAX6_9PROT|nr:transporter [Hellea balneolensis]
MTHKFAVFGVAPVIAKDTRTGPVKRDVSGLADIKIFGRYQLYRKDGPGTTTRLAPFFGVRLPTGRTGKTSDGSTDYFGGAVLTRATTYWNLDAQAQYTHNGRHGGFERGDESRLDASVQYRINAHDGNVNNHGYLFTVLEAGLVYADKNDIGGNADLNSGGRTAFIAPGLQYAAKRWIGEAAIKVPIMKDLNGNALQPGVTMITSIRVNF